MKFGCLPGRVLEYEGRTKVVLEYTKEMCPPPKRNSCLAAGNVNFRDFQKKSRFFMRGSVNFEVLL